MFAKIPNRIFYACASPFLLLLKLSLPERIAQPLIAIITQTVRTAVRSRVFHVLFAMILLAVFALPLVVSGDGTIHGQIQVTLTYSLSVVVALISATTLWLSCSQLPQEIESYTIHMVTTKPCPRFVIWAGKFLGIFFMHAMILAISAVIILVLVNYRLHTVEFDSKAEMGMERVRAEVLVARRAFRPEQPDFRALTLKEYDRRKKAGELDEGHNPGAIRSEIYRQLRAKSTEVPAGQAKRWIFKNVKRPKDGGKIYLRYRHYAGSTSAGQQKVMRGAWVVREVASGERPTYTKFPQQVLTGSFHERELDGDFVSANGTVEIGYENPVNAAEGTPGAKEDISVIFQHADGPELLVRVGNFSSNYARCIILALFQIAFLAALGCTVGAAFSTPVAAFAALAYLVIGMSIQAAIAAPLQNEFGEYEYSNKAAQAAHYLARGVGRLVVSVDDFDATSDLARGRLIDFKRLSLTAINLIFFRGGILAVFGLLILNRRELGTVIRR